MNSAMQILTDGIKVLSTPAEPALPVLGADWPFPGLPRKNMKGDLFPGEFCCEFMETY